jgi:hypothetical protein
MMETIITILSITQIISISLGVGSSTLAVLNFFTAIADGAIDPVERRMMGMTYTVLRVAMVLILLSTFGLGLYGYAEAGSLYLSSYIIAQYTLIAVLFINAILMTKRIMPSTLGPAIQAGSWYLLGFGMALFSLDMVDFSFLTFVIAYALELIFAALLINGTMAHLKKRNEEQKNNPSVTN